ncbi:MAG: PilN domain-containing protein [Minisyncoccia bacterium]
MESNIRSSFIPQSPVGAPQPGARRTGSVGGGVDMLTLLSLIFFIASATLAVGVFLYVQYMNTNAASKLEQLNRAKSAFEPSLIAELTRLDDRMRAADEVLGIHIAPSTLFRALEQLTLQTVAFSSLDFTAESATNMTLTMQGVAQSVNSIALEADLLSKSGIISNPIFSNINRTVGGVNFDFTSSLNAEGLRYRSVVQAAQAPQEQVDTSAPFGLPAEMTAPASGQ